MRMYLLTFHCILLAIYFFLPGVQALRWLGIKRPPFGVWNRTVCLSNHRHVRLLDRNQLKICRRRMSNMKYVVEAIELAVSECLKQTKHEKWDCKSILKAPTFSPDLREGTRESGFLHALSSAAIVFTITQGCTVHNLKRCFCGKKPEKRHRRVKKGSTMNIWAECHDNIAYGIRFSKDFLDSREMRQTKHASKMMMNLHNNDAGRKAVRESLTTTCRCHGLTGNCQIQTCTRQLPISFSDIAETLFRRYKNSRQVILDKETDGRRVLVPKRRRKNRNDKKSKAIDIREIIYLVRSRDFCKKDDKRNLPGTQGRECRRKSSNNQLNVMDACDYLCCGRGFVTTKSDRTEDCRCKFVWDLMDVVCKKCSVTDEVSTCR